ncbi:MAG: aspartyl protease family protein [Ignavibacteria bacterium]|nr:aspartyl protease family protein [Ignavibacteria bacterium]
MIRKISLLFLFLCLPFKSLVYSQSIPAKINEYGFVFIPITINDSITANFLMDTGGGMNILSSGVFNKVKSSAKFRGFETGFRHDGERLDGKVYEIPSIQIGGYKVNDVIVGEYPPLDEYGIEGIISLKFFENKPFTIDFKNKKFVIENKKSMSKIRKHSEATPILLDVFSDWAIDMYINLIVNDSISLKAEFDTGSGFDHIIMNPQYLQSMGVDTSTAKKNPYTTPISKTHLTDYLVKVNSIKCEGISSGEIKNRQVTFRQNMIHQALIGSGMFKDKAITIDIPNRKMYVR